MRQNLMRRAWLGLGGAFALSACAGVHPSGLLAASRLDPLNTAPADIAVAVGAPESIRLADGDVALRIAFAETGREAAPLVDETAPLRIARDAPNAPAPNAAGEIVSIASFAPEDAARIAEAQARIKALRASGVAGRGTLSVMVIGGCAVRSPIEALPVSTWLRTAPDGGFAPLTRRADAFGALGADQAAALRARLTPCDAAPG